MGADLRYVDGKGYFYDNDNIQGVKPSKFNTYKKGGGESARFLSPSGVKAAMDQVFGRSDRCPLLSSDGITSRR